MSIDNIGISPISNATISALRAPAKVSKTEQEQPQPLRRLENNSFSPSEILNQNEINTRNWIYLLQRIFSDQHSVIAASGTLTTDTTDALSVALNMTPTQAEAYIAEDGFWGVERTAERLFNMAKTLSGGCEDLMQEMKAAVIRGFEAASHALGGELPEISRETLDRVLELFDN